MKRAIQLSTLALLMLLVGCTSPTKQAYVAELTFNGAGREVIKLKDANKLTGDSYEAVAILFNAAGKLLPDVEQAAKDAEAAGPTDTIQAHFHFNKLIGSLNEIIDQITAKLLAKKNQ